MLEDFIPLQGDEEEVEEASRLVRKDECEEKSEVCCCQRACGMVVKEATGGKVAACV